MTAHPDKTARAVPVVPGAAQTESRNIAPLSLALTVPALAARVREVRLAARKFAERHGVERPDDVALAMSEACANVVVHAYVDREVGDLRMTGALDGALVRFVVLDDGAGLIPRPDSPGLGLGLPLIAQLADEFEVSDGDGRGTRVRMAFAITDRTAA